MTERYAGTGVTPLSGVGRATWYDPGEFEYDRDADDPAEQRERFEAARDVALDAIATARDRATERVGEEEAAVFDAHREFLNDPQIETTVADHVEAGRTAEAAVEAAFGGHIEQFESMDGRMAERADDLRDVRDRLLGALVGAEAADLGALPEGTVLLAERLTPSDTAQLDSTVVAGFATVRGGRTSHAAIFARSLAIPAVVGVGDALEAVPEDTTVVIDGSAGEVVVDPDDETRRRAETARDVEVIRESVTTEDGTHVEVAANVGTAAEVEPAMRQGADGVGLFRTEFLFLDRSEPPDEAEQVEVYRDALDAFPDGRVVVRTLDVGGDKPIPYLDAEPEANPFLGERGIRRSLGPDAELFETQLRALLRAAANGAGDLAVMFPLVATVEELDAALDALDAARVALESEGIDCGDPEVGVMIETPAAVFAAPAMADRVSFLSIGTNDLAQYVMAADRENERVAHLHDPLHPPVLRAIARTVEAGRDGDAWVGMCGEMAGDPAYTDLLLGLGLEELSMSAVTVPAVKARVRDADLDRTRSLANRCLDADTRAKVVEYVSNYQ